VNNGKPAASAERMNEFEAIADAAYGRYASTRNVKVEENASTLYTNNQQQSTKARQRRRVKKTNIPNPNGIEKIMGTIQWTLE
jgi:hypothetical protein